MKPFRRVARIGVPVAVFIALTTGGLGCTRRPAAAASPREATTPSATPSNDSLARARQQFIDQVTRQIAGRENELATTVFRNVQALTFQVTAAQLVRSMDFFDRSLGVGCNYCHIIGRWEEDSLRTKRIARQMIRLNGTINNELGKIREFERPVGVACWTCHRGLTRPARPTL